VISRSLIPCIDCCRAMWAAQDGSRRACRFARIENGLQAAVMAPTEILAEQHFRKFGEWLGPPRPANRVVHREPNQERARLARAAIASGRATVAIALTPCSRRKWNSVHLGLAVVDEQHRFGVAQRLALRTKERAAPADDECDADSENPFDELLRRSRRLGHRRAAAGKKAGVNETRRRFAPAGGGAPHPRGLRCRWPGLLGVPPDRGVRTAAAADGARYARDAQPEFPELRVGLIHGRLRPDEKAQMMAAFLAGTIQLLVGTTVIEVGVDVPNVR